MSDFKLSPINSLHNKALASDKMVMLLTEGDVNPADTDEVTEALENLGFGASSVAWIPVTNKCAWSRYANSTDGVITQSTSRKRYVATCSASEIKLAFANHYVESNGYNPITVKAAVEDDAGVITPVYFSGSRTTTVPVDGSLVISDVVEGVSFTAGKTYYVRTNVSFSSGQKTYLNAVMDNTTSPGEGRIDGVDRTDSGVITPTTNYAYTPVMVLGKPTTTRKSRPVIGLVGDSIMDMYEVGGAVTWEDNWSVTALGFERGRNYSHIRLSVGGSTAAGGTTSRRGYYYQYLTHAVVNLGINDVRGADSLATIQANLQTVWRNLKAAGVEKIWQCTITPDTSAGADEVTRVALNDWIRTVPNPLFGVIECADEMETARNSGVWKVGYNDASNYHPSMTGGIALRSLMPLPYFD